MSNSESSKEQKPVLRSIFEYSNYREFLRDYYFHSKISKRSFSFRFFSRLCEFKSSNFLMLVMQGKTSLTSVSVEKVIRGIKLNKEEANFFRNLVMFNEAKTPQQKSHYAQEMIGSRTFNKIFPLTEAQYRYLGTWYLPVIRGVVGLDGFKKDIKWIADHMHPTLKIAEVQKALDELVALGLVQRDKDGNYSKTTAQVTTPSEVISTFAGQYHRQMLERAAESIDRFPREKRHLAGVTVALSEDSVKKAKEMAEKFRSDLMQLGLSQNSIATAIYQVNLQIFPVFLSTNEREGRE